MNKKIFLSLFMLIAIPLTGLAQQGDIDPQGDSSCISIVNNLRYRTTDANTSGEVSVLQDFLQAGGYLKSNPVGFFGLMTTAAVKKFQKENNISPTGYVGPITRQKIKDQSCSSQTSVNAEDTTGQSQPATITFTPSPVLSQPTTSDRSLYKNISLGATGFDVTTLQQFLVAKGFLVMPAGVAMGYFDQNTKDAVISFQKASHISPADGVVGPIVRSIINNQGRTVVYTPPTVSNDTIIPVPPVVRNTISITADTSSSNVINGSYKVNLSFNGGTAAQPVYSWKLYIQCPSNVDVNTVPGTSCNSLFQMGAGSQNYGNVLNKEFYFKNYSGSTQTVNLILSGYNSSSDSLRSNMGSYKATIQIPPTSSGQQTWSQVSVLSPNGGESFVVGKPMIIKWKTTIGTFQFVPTSSVKIYLMQTNPGQSNVVKATFSNLPNSGYASVTIPSNILAGSNYKVSVTVSAEAPAPTGSAQADDSDSTFTITAPVIIAPPSPSCPAGQTFVGSMCTVQVQESSGQPYVKIISPNGGEKFIQGQTVPISFSTNLTSQQVSNGFNIMAYYGGSSTNVGSYASGVQNIAMNWKGGSPYSWTIPSSMATGNYVMYMVPSSTVSGVSNVGLFSFGNNYFTINAK